MAQLVEQRIRNAWVAGSSPARGSFLLCEISTSVVHRLPKPVRRVRLPYLAQVLIISNLHHFHHKKHSKIHYFCLQNRYKNVHNMRQNT